MSMLILKAWKFVHLVHPSRGPFQVLRSWQYVKMIRSATYSNTMLTSPWLDVQSEVFLKYGQHQQSRKRWWPQAVDAVMRSSPCYVTQRRFEYVLICLSSLLTPVLSFLRRMFAMVSDDHFGLDILLDSCLFEGSNRAAVDGSQSH